MSADELTREVGDRLAEIASGVRAPASLRAAVAEERLREGARARPRSIGARVLAGALGAVALATIALVLLLPGGEATPTIADAATVGLRAPAQPPPPTGEDGYLALDVGGVRFPDTPRTGGWRPVGMRTDRLAGRRAHTITYARAARRIGYTIVDGGPLPVPRDARRAAYGGTDARLVRRGDLVIVTWRRGGLTCVLAGRGADAAALLELAGRS